MIDIDKLLITDIQPSQLYISLEKINNVKKWFVKNDLTNIEPLPIKIINNSICFTDGHTRAYVAYSMGITRLPLIWDTDDIDNELYEICVKACKKSDIYSVVDLEKRILQKKDYEQKWYNWCDTVAEVIELQKQ